MLIVELDGAAAEVRAPVRAGRRRSAGEAGAFEIRIAADDAERALFWKGRKSAFAAVGRISPDYIVQDGVIPRTVAARRCCAGSPQLSADSGVRVANVFHAGDGNLHPLVLFDDARAGRGRAGRGGLGRDHATSASSSAARSPASTASGPTRPSSCRKMFGEHDLDTMQLVRCAFDPRRISNPGKIFPTPRLCGEVPGPARGAHPLVEAGLAEQFLMSVDAPQVVDRLQEAVNGRVREAAAPTPSTACPPGWSSRRRARRRCRG